MSADDRARAGKLARAVQRRGFQLGNAPIRLGRLLEPGIVLVLCAVIAALFWNGLR